MEACRKSNRNVKIVYTSTRQLYGKPLYLPVDENHIAQPTDVNGINKLCGELYHILYHNIYGIRSVSLRLTNCYGPRQLLKHSRQGFINWFIRLLVEGKEIQLFGDGSQMRDFNYIDDVVDALLLAGMNDKSNGEIFNLGGDEPISLKDLVELMIEVNGSGSYQLVPFPEEKKAIDIGSFYSDYTKIKKVLGWQPKVRLREGLKKTFDYYKENFAWYRE
jgi:UDP-glucose 4-epimerase